MFVVILAPDAGNFWSMSIENTMNHKQHFLIPHGVDSLPQHLYLRQWEGDKVGYKWDTSGKTHKTMAEHEFILRQQGDTKGFKNREKHETRIQLRWNSNRTLPLRQTYDWRQIKWVWKQMKYETDGERHMMEDTVSKANRRKAGHHQGRPMIGDKLIWRQINLETHGEGQMMRDKWKHRKDIRRAWQHYRQAWETNEGRHVKRHIQRAEHHQPETEPNDGKQDETSKERHLKNLCQNIQKKDNGWEIENYVTDGFCGWNFFAAKCICVAKQKLWLKNPGVIRWLGKATSFIVRHGILTLV